MPLRIRPYPISAVLVTRGNVDMEPVLESLPFEETVVYDNSGEVCVRREGVVWRRDPVPDVGVYGRYEGIRYATHSLVYVQDDDAILPPRSLRLLCETALAPAYLAVSGLLETAPPPPSIVANMPERFRPHYPDSCLVGFGAVFDRRLPAAAFGKLVSYLAGTGETLGADAFHRTCDVFFSTLTPRTLLDLPHDDREFASAPDRMWRQPQHVPERSHALDLARRVRDTAA